MGIEKMSHSEVNDENGLDLIQKALALHGQALETIDQAKRESLAAQACVSRAREHINNIKIENIALRSEKDREASLANKYMKDRALLKGFIETQMALSQAKMENCKDPGKEVLEGKVVLIPRDFMKKAIDVLLKTR